MKIAMIGRGAIGTLYGQLFEQGGQDVIFLVDETRKKRYEADPLICNGKSVDFHYETQTEPVDLLFLATKYAGLNSAIALAGPSIDAHTLIVSALNGIRSEDELRQAFPNNLVIRTIVQGMDSTYLQNQCTYHVVGELVFGPDDPNQKEACQRLNQLYTSCAIPHRWVDDIIKEQWNKLMLNCGLNQTCAAYYTTYGGIKVDGPLQDIYMKAMLEVKAVANAQNIAITDADVQHWFEVMKPMSNEGMPSMRQDIIAHRKTELALFSGTVVPIAKQLGIQTPVLEDLAKRIQAIEAAF
ncbi:MAG: ketopantoate reductase family protein [Absicoccus sp.]|uniref:ketopantoate reductase family protein n=1 Tax=Absicoccus sp. TaxID=2718527 RepID=UPI002A7616F6|nr:ketopantoate reductase family protein [Absicoccus sp.]MDY3035762.1 ketopantoate reductase family protein [Absicoccus sp.]